MNIMKKISRCAFLIIVVLLFFSFEACAPTTKPVPISEPEDSQSNPSPTLIEPAAITVTVVEPTAIPTTAPVSQPTPSDGVERITIEELKTLMDRGESILILDARPRDSYYLGHIMGAMSFPWKPKLTLADTEEISLSKLIVTYCDCGPGEADGSDVARQLMEMGATNVKTLAHPSIEGWLELGYPSQ